MESKKDFAPLILRVTIGLMFALAGVSKLMNPDGIVGMLGSIGFPIAAFFGWIVILSELVFGITVLIGWKTKYTVWPLVVILAVAALLVSLPALIKNPTSSINFFFHLVTITGLVSIYLTGPGAWAVKGKF